MDVADILIDMETRSRTANRRSPEFVESVDWEMERTMQGGLETSMLEARNMFLLAVVRGVYIDSDLGTREVIVYLANSVLYFGNWESVPDKFDARTVVRDADELRRIADKALFIAACIPCLNRDVRLGRDFYEFTGTKSYQAMCAIDTRRRQRGRFRELANNFRHYVEALEHTAKDYLWQDA